MIDPLPTISKAINLVIQEEGQRSIGINVLAPHELVALVAINPYVEGSTVVATATASPGRGK